MDDKSRIEKLEKELDEIKKQIKTEKPVKKPRAPKEPTEYNKFVKAHIAKLKVKFGEKYDHKKGFKSAAEEWSKTKSSSK